MSNIGFSYILALAALLALSPAQAVAESKLRADQLETKNKAIVDQIGEVQRATIEQHNVQGGLLSGTIRQDGLDNNASISLEGGDLSGRVVQYGIDNKAALEVRDDHNQGAIEQYGDGNSAGLQIDGYGNDVTLLQQGDGHSYGSPIRVGGDTPGGLPITIRQY
jgi:hypothetical protein